MEQFIEIVVGVVIASSFGSGVKAVVSSSAKTAETALQQLMENNPDSPGKELAPRDTHLISQTLSRLLSGPRT